MKKITGILVAATIVISTVFANSVSYAQTVAATITGLVDIDIANKVTIQGNISTGAGQRITITVTNPSNDLDFIDQTTSGAEGSFQFQYVTGTSQTGIFRVSIAGTNVDPVFTTSFRTDLKVADKSELIAAVDNAFAVHTAAVEGTQAGMYPLGSRAVLLAAITTARNVADSANATQSQVDAAVVDLNQAVGVFKALVIVEQPNGNGPGKDHAKEDKKNKYNIDFSTGIPVFTTAKPTLKKGKENASVEIPSKALEQAVAHAVTDAAGMKIVRIIIPKVEGATAYMPILPTDIFTVSEADYQFEIVTDLAKIIVPGDMLRNVENKKIKDVVLTIAKADTSDLTGELRAQIAGKPVVEFNVSVDVKKASYSNPDAPMTISIPYKPTAEELKHPERIVVWYIDGQGRAVSVPGGRYHAASGMVVFNTTLFGRYAVVYIP